MARPSLDIVVEAFGFEQMHGRLADFGQARRTLPSENPGLGQFGATQALERITQPRIKGDILAPGEPE
jgi:hypothetical protein